MRRRRAWSSATAWRMERGHRHATERGTGQSGHKGRPTHGGKAGPARSRPRLTYRRVLWRKHASGRAPAPLAGACRHLRALPAFRTRAPRSDTRSPIAGGHSATRGHDPGARGRVRGCVGSPMAAGPPGRRRVRPETLSGCGTTAPTRCPRAGQRRAPGVPPGSPRPPTCQSREGAGPGGRRGDGRTRRTTAGPCRAKGTRDTRRGLVGRTGRPGTGMPPPRRGRRTATA